MSALPAHALGSIQHIVDGLVINQHPFGHALKTFTSASEQLAINNNSVDHELFTDELEFTRALVSSSAVLSVADSAERIFRQHVQCLRDNNLKVVRGLSASEDLAALFEAQQYEDTPLAVAAH